MTFKSYLFVTLIYFLLSCRSGDSSNSIVLKIILTKDKADLLSNKYVYLVDASKRSVVDSVLVKGDTVVFNERWTPSFIPYMVSVERNDTFQGHPYLRPMGFKSPYDAKVIYSWFYLDKGTTVLKPYLTGSNNEQSDFIGSNQNEPYFKQVELQYPEKSVNRPALIEKNISKIKSYPYSIHLLQQLFHYKEKFLKDDLENQLSFFDNNVKNTPLFKRFPEYFAISSTFDKAFPSIEFESQGGSFRKIGGDSAEYYLIVYWASWCGPCRKEIPDIKELYNKFTNRGLAITSISIDGDKRNWQTALQQEKMPWQQLIAVDSTKAFLDLNYDIKAIPKAYLFNRKKQLIKTFDDGDGVVMANHINSLF